MLCDINPYQWSIGRVNPRNQFSEVAEFARLSVVLIGPNVEGNAKHKWEWSTDHRVANTMYDLVTDSCAKNIIPHAQQAISIGSPSPQYVTRSEFPSNMSYPVSQ
ncbi:MAG: hypothetical protein GY700_01645 [Propionibacteriaceae bacterium]|nr:hypothetical protein [Propionibacteriaceae bacterium]